MMRNKLPLSRLPLLSLCAGAAGLLLRLWLFSAGLDEKGLLVISHPANVLVFVLTALVLAALFLATRNCSASQPATGVVAAAGSFMGAAGILATDVAEYLTAPDTISLVCCLLGLVATGALVLCGVCQLRGKAVSSRYPGIVALYFALHLLTQFRVWSPEPELQRYFFPLLASVFLMLTTYQMALLCEKGGKYTPLQWLSRAGLFFCLLSLYPEGALFYGTMGLWLLSMSVLPKED